MLYYKRFPRKLKKQLKKNPEEWENLVKERRVVKDREEHLDTIFTKDYDNSRKIVRRIIRTGRSH